MLSMATLEDREPSMEDESDADLLIFMSMRDSDATTAKEAWNVFYKRHSEYLYRLCRRVLYGFLHTRYQYPEIKDMARESVKDTMIRVFERAETFHPNGSGDVDSMRLQVRGWLGSVARNVVVDWLRSGHYESGVDGLVEIEDTEDDIVDNNESSSNALYNCIQKILDSLPDKQRMVVYAYLQHYDPRKDSGRLPNEESKWLAQSLGLTPASLRQIKGRAYRQLETEIRSKCMGQDQE